MIVVDASAVADVLLTDSEAFEWVAAQLTLDANPRAPHLLDAEVVSLLRRRVARRQLPAERAETALFDLRELALTRYPMVALVRRMWELRHTLSAYDAAYVALAESLNAPLVTTDLRLARSRGHDAEILAPG